MYISVVWDQRRGGFNTEVLFGLNSTENLRSFLQGVLVEKIAIILL